MPWHDVHSDAPGGAWIGVEWVGPRRSPEPPGFRVEAASPAFMRLVAGGAPLVWARVAPDHCGYWYLRSGAPARTLPRAIPPITAAASRKVRGEQGADPWYAAWSRVFLRALQASPRSPLHAGRWWMVPCPTDQRDDPGSRGVGRPWPLIPPAAYLDQLPAQPAHELVMWDFHDALPPLSLRRLSPESDGRVKVWRKAFREGCLPPVLLLWVSGLCRYVLLDGHDRLLAAMLEGHAPPALALLPLAESKPEVDLYQREAITHAIDQLRAAPKISLPGPKPFPVEFGNRLLIEAYDDRPSLALVSRAWPLRGGVSGWLGEVQTELRRSGIEGEVYSEMSMGDEP